MADEQQQVVEPEAAEVEQPEGEVVEQPEVTHIDLSDSAAALELIEAEQARERSIKESKRDERRADRLIDAQKRRYSIDEYGNMAEGATEQDWLDARWAMVNGDLSEKRAATAQEIQNALLEKQIALQQRGLLQQQNSPLTPAYFDANGNPVGPAAAEAARQMQRDKEIFDEVHARIAPANFAQLVAKNGDTPITPELQAAIYKARGVEVFYHLLENPGEVARLNNLSGMALDREIWRLQGRIQGGHQQSEIRSRAPKPPTPVRKPSVQAYEDLYDDSMDVDKWMRLRNQQIAKGGGQ